MGRTSGNHQRSHVAAAFEGGHQPAGASSAPMAALLNRQKPMARARPGRGGRKTFGTRIGFGRSKYYSCTTVTKSLPRIIMPPKVMPSSTAFSENNVGSRAVVSICTTRSMRPSPFTSSTLDW